MTIPAKVLIVSDDEAMAKSFEQVLSGKGLTVVPAHSGEDALWKLDSDSYDGLFTDLELRGISGLDLADEAHARRPNLPLFIVTDKDPETVQERAAAAGVTGVLRKPLASDQIAQSADQVLNAAAAAAPASTAATETAAPVTAFVGRMRNIVLFVLAPILGLIYILLFPVIGLGALIWFGVKSIGEKPQAPAATAAGPTVVKPSLLLTIIKLPGVALLGIAYGILGPIVAIGVLIWFFFEAWGKLGAKAIKARET